MKKCNKCSQTKNNDEFYFYNNKQWTTCKKCHYENKRRQQTIKGTPYWWQRRYQRLREAAKERGKEFNLTFTETKALWAIKNCYYCEKPAEVQTIDRVDNSKPYTKSNCVMACWYCNRRKSTFSLEEFKNFYDKMVKYH